LKTEDVPRIETEIAKIGDVKLVDPPSLSIPTSHVTPNAAMIEWAFMEAIPRGDYTFELEMARTSDEERAQSSFLDFSPVYKGQEMRFFAEGLESGVDYVFRVRVVSHSGVTSWSKIKGISTPRVQGFSKGPNCIVADGGFTATKDPQSKAGWNATVVGKLPLIPGVQHSWNIEIRNSALNNIFVGVAPLDIDRTSEENGVSCGYYMFIREGSLYSGPPYNARGYQYNCIRAITPGSVIGTHIDLLTGTLGFSVNGQYLGPAFVNLPIDRPLIPVVLMHDPGDCVIFRPPGIGPAQTPSTVVPPPPPPHRLHNRFMM